MPLVLDIAGRDLVFEVDDRGCLRVALGGTSRELTLAQCGELVSLARAALRAGQQGLDLGELEAPAPRAESISEAAAPGTPRTAPSVEELERAVRELKDATRGQRRLAL